MGACSTAGSWKKCAFKYMGDPATPTRPKQKYVAGEGHGKSPRINTPIEQDRSEEASDEEERPPKKGKKEAPPPEAFKWDQPMIRMKRHKVVERSKKWFERNHPFIKKWKGGKIYFQQSVLRLLPKHVPQMVKRRNGPKKFQQGSLGHKLGGSVT